MVLLDSLCVKVDTTLATSSSRRLRLHSGLDLRGHGKECLFNICTGLRGSLQKLNTQRVGEFLALFRADYAFGRQIRLVAHQQLVDVLRSVSVNFMEPLLYVRERLGVSNIIDDDNSVCTAVVRRSDGSESLLSSSIPNLEFDSLFIEIDGTDFLEKYRENE